MVVLVHEEDLFRLPTDVDECAQSPCQNGGTCSNEQGGYTCHCTQAFTGKHCDKGD